MEYDKIETGTGGEAMNTDTTLAKNLGVADEKAGQRRIQQCGGRNPDGLQHYRDSGVE